MFLKLSARDVGREWHMLTVSWKGEKLGGGVVEIFFFSLGSLTNPSVGVKDNLKSNHEVQFQVAVNKRGCSLMIP